MRLFFPLILLLLTAPVLNAQSKKEKKQLYRNYIAAADSAFAKKDYQTARLNYEKASALNSKEEHPKNRITECDRLIPVQNAEYKKLVRRADSCFEIKAWDCAKDFYLKAVSVKPTEPYARDQAKTCNYNIVAKNAMEQNYKNAVRLGDSCFAIKSWACARTNYQSALNIRPEEKYPADRLKLCDEKMKKEVVSERYAIVIADADSRFDAGNYSYAKTLYEEALSIKPDSLYAAERIKLCNEKLKGGQ